MSWCNASSKPTRNMTAQVDVQIAVEDESIPSANEIARWVSRAIDVVGGHSDAEVSVRIVSPAEMQQLNSEFREQDKSTNVLSFPAGAIAGLPADADIPLGDIVVCSAVVSEEALQQGKSLHDHWAHMIIHGTLHLLGFDHTSNAEAIEMEGLEVQVLDEYGIPNPYRESPLEN